MNESYVTYLQAASIGLNLLFSSCMHWIKPAFQAACIGLNLLVVTGNICNFAHASCAALDTLD